MPYGKFLSGLLSSTRRLLWQDKRLLSVGFFLLVSIILWTFNKLSHSYIYELPAQIELVIPNSVSYVISSSNATQVQLRVNARGYDLLRYNLFAGKKFKVAITPNERSSANNTLSVATAPLRNAVSQQLGTDFRLQAISPDSITLQISRIAAKKVPVRSNFRISYAPQYMQQGATLLTPDSVVVSGAESAVQDITEVLTEQLVKEKLSSKQSGKVDLIAPPQVFLSHQRVSYSIDVLRFIEISYELPIHISGVPDTLSIAVLPATAKVTFSVTMKEYSRLKSENIHLTVNYSELSQSIADQLHVQLNNPPNYVLSTTIVPSFVNVISMRK
jgi:hypothetical protein